MKPYQDLPPRSFWRTGVAQRNPLDYGDIYRKKFPLAPTDRIATAGSCFAQHISVRLRAGGYSVIDAEPPPPTIAAELATAHGYRLYSARYGNLYTTRQLRQLAEEALDGRELAEPAWTLGDRFIDPQRPTVEPGGLATAEEVRLHRQFHLRHVAEVFTGADVIIFTLGLTETWEHRDSGDVYPTAPGTVGGEWDPDRYAFRNLTHAEVLEDFLVFRDLVRRARPDVRFLLTVSPVPLTATATDEHVLAATLYSKSVLRAVAGELYHRFDDIDYFPSYEIVASHPSRGFFYESNLRSVAADGVDVVMRAFAREHPPVTEAAASSPGSGHSRADVVCEEQLLEAFAR